MTFFFVPVRAIKMTLFFCASDFHLNLNEFCFPLQKERSYCLQKIFWMLMVTNEAEILCSFLSIVKIQKGHNIDLLILIFLCSNCYHGFAFVF